MEIILRCPHQACPSEVLLSRCAHSLTIHFYRHEFGSISRPRPPTFSMSLTSTCLMHAVFNFLCMLWLLIISSHYYSWCIQINGYTRIRGNTVVGHFHLPYNAVVLHFYLAIVLGKHSWNCEVSPSPDIEPLSDVCDNESDNGSVGDHLSFLREDDRDARIKLPSYWHGVLAPEHVFAGKNLNKQVNFAMACVTRTMSSNAIEAVSLLFNLAD